MQKRITFLFSIISVALGCASEPQSEKGVGEINQYNQDATAHPDMSGMESADLGLDMAPIATCEPSLGTTFELSSGSPVYVGAIFSEGDRVLQHAVIRTQVNEDFQVAFDPNFVDVSFSFDSFLKLNVETDVVRFSGTIATKTNDASTENVNIEVCVREFGDVAEYWFNLENHMLKVQFYVSKDPPK